MLLHVTGFLLALLFAIPTFGLSLLAFFVIKYFIDAQSVSRIALTAHGAQIGEPIATTDVSNAAIRKFYNKYGTTEKKCERFKGPDYSFIGYVDVGNGETVTVIQLANGGIIVSCIDPPAPFGNDFLSIARKSEFIKEIMQKLQNIA
jgi:hypothetical protein